MTAFYNFPFHVSLFFLQVVGSILHALR